MPSAEGVFSVEETENLLLLDLEVLMEVLGSHEELHDADNDR